MRSTTRLELLLEPFRSFHAQVTVDGKLERRVRLTLLLHSDGHLALLFIVKSVMA